MDLGSRIPVGLVVGILVRKSGCPSTAVAAAPLLRPETAANLRTRWLLESATQRLSAASTKTPIGLFIFIAESPVEKVVKSGWPRTRSGVEPKPGSV